MGNREKRGLGGGQNVYGRQCCSIGNVLGWDCSGVSFCLISRNSFLANKYVFWIADFENYAWDKLNIEMLADR